MDITNKEWKNLPPELLDIILKFAATKQSKAETFNVALVCKSWLKTAQTVAYSNVALETTLQFNKFHDVIIHSTHLGIKVKTLHFKFQTYDLQEADKLEVSHRLTSLLTTSLPNLEFLNKFDLYTCVPTLNTLLDSQLRHLRRLQRPIDLVDEYGFENYVKCAFKMKDRLENIYIMWGPPFLGERQHERINIAFQHLYDSLHRFDNLVDLKIAIKTNDGIQILEYIVDSCKSLKNIQISFKISTDQPIHARPISEYIPTSNVKSLNISMNDGKNDFNLLWYIMHKFSQLQLLHLDLFDADPAPDIHLIAQFLDYVSTIEDIFMFGLSTNQSNLLEVVGYNWEKTAKPGNETLLIHYPDYCPDNVKTVLFITKEVSEGIKTTLQYPTNMDFNWGTYMDLIKEKGKYIGTMSFDFTLEDDLFGRPELPENVFPHMLTYCPHLKNIHLKGFTLRHFNYSVAEFGNKFSISELSIQYCSIQHGMFKQLSPLLYKINILHLRYNTVYKPNVRLYEENPIGQSHLMIDMPYTNIDHIVFQMEASKEEIYVKLFVSTDEKCYYFKMVDTGRNQWINISTEKQYISVNNEEHIYVRCLAKPTLDIKTFV